MIVVADTSPIIYLIAIAQIEVLPKLYAAVLIPPTVKKELQSFAAPGAVRQWIGSPPKWLQVRQPTRAPKNCSPPRLPGEGRAEPAHRGATARRECEDRVDSAPGRSTTSLHLGWLPRSTAAANRPS